jgi:hypothetical protein
MADLAGLADDIFGPPPPRPLAVAVAQDELDDADEAALDAVLHRMLVRRKHASRHAWTAERESAPAREGAAERESAPAREGAAAHERATEPSPLEEEEEEAADTADVRQPPLRVESLRIPRESDRVALLQTVAIKDAVLRQMEAALLLPPPDQAVTVGLSRRAQALVANARRREAVMGCKVKALSHELDGFRRREAQAAQINLGLRRRLKEALTDVDAIALRREVRTLRADLSAALAREAELRRVLLLHQQRIESDAFTIAQHEAKEQKLRDDMEYLRRVASASLSARAADAMGVSEHSFGIHGHGASGLPRDHYQY